jgi:MFS family permease
VYIILLGALTALGPFTIDLYLPAFPTLQADFRTSAAAIQLTLTGTMVGFALGQLIVGPLSDKVGRRVPLLAVTALHVVASAAAALAPISRSSRSRACSWASGPQPVAWSRWRSSATCSEVAGWWSC